MESMIGADVQDLLNFGAFCLVFVLAALAFTAYRTGRHQRMIFVTLAFLLWDVRLGIGVLSSFVVPGIEGTNWAELAGTLLDVVTAVLFALAVLWTGRRSD